jgi:hypothetical protein
MNDALLMGMLHGEDDNKGRQNHII